jgi:hypothetical protein
MATLLDRQNGDSELLLGQLYMGEAMYDRAQKYLTHPSIKKKPEAKKLIEQIQLDQKRKERQSWVLYGFASTGAFVWLPLLLLKRRFSEQENENSPVVIDADQVKVFEEVIASVEAKEPVPSIENEPEPLPEESLHPSEGPVQPAGLTSFVEEMNARWGEQVSSESSSKTDDVIEPQEIVVPSVIQQKSFDEIPMSKFIKQPPQEE